MTPSELFLLRLYHQGLMKTQPDLVTALTTTIGIQAQQQSKAQINLGLRVSKLQISNLNQLYHEKGIVRSWAQRWTHQLMTYDDWQLVIAARANERLPKAYYLGERDLVVNLADVIIQELARNSALTRATVNNIISPYLSDKKWQTNFTYAVLQTIVAQGLAYFDPATTMRNYRLVVAKTKSKLSATVAIERLMIRYLAGFGPATIDDFSKWSGIKIGQIRPIWNKVAANLVPVQVEDRELYALHYPQNNLLETLCNQLNQECLLAARFDSCMTGYADKRWFVPKIYERKMWSKNGILMAPIILRGRLIGHWVHKTIATGLVITINYWQQLSNTDKTLIELQLEQVAYFLETPISTVIYRKI